MKKVNMFLTIVAIICFVLCVIKTHKTLLNITSDFDSSVYIKIGEKDYSKETIIEYYKQVFRYIYYFIFFFDIRSIGVLWENW